MPYKNIEDYPYRISMGRSSKKCKKLDKLKTFNTILKRFINSFVGKSLNQAYSALCKKYPNNIGHINPREQFRNIINHNYLIDEDGIIRHLNTDKSKKRYIKVPVRKLGDYYEFDTIAGRLYYLLKVLSYKEAYYIARFGEISHAQYLRIRKSDVWPLLKEYIKVFSIYEYDIVYKGTRLYSKIRAEEHDRIAKQNRKAKDDYISG